jgi:hypothetical protein
LCYQCSCFSRFHLFLLPFLVWAPAAAPPLQGYKLCNKSDRVWVNYRCSSPSPSTALPSRPPTRPGITVTPARRPPRPRSRCPQHDAPSPRARSSTSPVMSSSSLSTRNPSASAPARRTLLGPRSSSSPSSLTRRDLHQVATHHLGPPAASNREIKWICSLEFCFLCSVPY